MNQLFVVGRVKDIEKNEKYSTLKLEVSRSYKNTDGIYEKDVIPIILFKNLSENVLQYCKKNDVLGCKGTMQFNNFEKKLNIIAERISFLSTSTS